MKVTCSNLHNPVIQGYSDSVEYARVAAACARHATTSGNVLPFTGANLILWALVAVALVATGVLLRRSSGAN